MVADLCCRRSWLYSRHPPTVRTGTALQTREPGNLEDRKDEISETFIRKTFLFSFISKLTHLPVADCQQLMG